MTTPYWLDDPRRPAPLPPLDGDLSADLVVVGGGYLGLWSALVATERNPDRSVVLVEQATCGHAASGRNGGFVEPSLTHGFDNGLARWPDDLPELLALGHENLRAIEEAVATYGIDCDLHRAGELTVAMEAYQVAGLREAAEARQAHGEKVELLEGGEARERFGSPLTRAVLRDPDVALVEPARLAWGLRQACLDRGVRVVEGTEVVGLSRSAGRVVVETAGGVVLARRVVLATNAYPSLLRRLRLMTVPVWDYVLMSEPLTPEQVAAVGWPGREGVGDAGHQFHYLRLTRDDRILFGGYDAIYHYGSGSGPEHEDREETYATLAEHFTAYFPALDGVEFTHRWGGVIDTSTQFAAFYGRAMDGMVGYAAGFTGLGVAATRFAAEVVLDLVDGATTRRTQLAMVRRRPPPFPPEPVRYAGIQATRWSLARADANEGRANLWLRATEKLGLGFDS